MDIRYEYDVQDVLINSRKARPEPEPNWRSAFCDMKQERNDWMKRALRAEEDAVRIRKLYQDLLNK